MKNFEVLLFSLSFQKSPSSCMFKIPQFPFISSGNIVTSVKSMGIVRHKFSPFSIIPFFRAINELSILFDLPNDYCFENYQKNPSVF